MFDRGQENYRSDIKIGEKYRDTQTGVEGVATCIHFYQHACERVTLEFYDRQTGMQELTFDAPRLQHIDTGKVAKTEKTGGPARAGERRQVPTR